MIYMYILNVFALHMYVYIYGIHTNIYIHVPSVAVEQSFSIFLCTTAAGSECCCPCHELAGCACTGVHAKRCGALAAAQRSCRIGPHGTHRGMHSVRRQGPWAPWRREADQRVNPEGRQWLYRKLAVACRSTTYLICIDSRCLSSILKVRPNGDQPSLVLARKCRPLVCQNHKDSD